ncbi:MAG: RpiB/LacA/LacB family sugar-phosphate isomerase [bacterium]|nr:RpiB/LacA/LacB family sugar-phosphate isomerase [bacterium]
MPLHLLLVADHGGFADKQTLKVFLEREGYSVEECGSPTLDPNDDYPEIVAEVAAKMANAAPDTRAILLCRSGAGMTMAANRFPYLRAVTALTPEQAQHARNDEDANVLSLSADWLSQVEQEAIVRAFLTTPFTAEERHVRRIEQLSRLGR